MATLPDALSVIAPYSKAKLRISVAAEPDRSDVVASAWGGAEVYREYRIAVGKAYEWSFRLRALEPATKALGLR